MMERFLDWFIESRFCVPAEVTLITWCFVGYWIGVSGWEFMLGWKLGIALTPVVIFTIHGIMKNIITRYHNRKRQKEILFNVKVRRILDQYVA